jgi:SagB-type dehydrogenase family enzyme
MQKCLFYLIIAMLAILLPLTDLTAQDAKDIVLPSPSKTGGLPLMDALNARSSCREFSSKELSQQELSDLLWAADGINRPESGKRTAPTAMNWQDLDIYVVLPAGIYLYLPKENILKLKKSGNYMVNTGKQDFVGNAALNLVFVSDLSKMVNAKNEDKILYAGIHAGAVTQNVYLYCASVGLNTVTRRSIDIEKLTAILELSKAQMIVLAQTVGYKP